MFELAYECHLLFTNSFRIFVSPYKYKSSTYCQIIVVEDMKELRFGGNKPTFFPRKVMLIFFLNGVFNN